MKLEFFQALGITIGSTIILTGNSVLAQITPDATLPNNSQIRLQDNIRFIEGGTSSGGNLFHSFKEFSVPSNSTAHFNNATDVQNILTRVTGGSVSNIDGLIRANGNANLFLINPSGIIFGQNARLDIGGSFVGTTANAIGFGNLGNFSATNPEALSPLLTINPNALLFNQIQGGRIESNSIVSVGNNPSNDFDARVLRVVDGKSLLLVGGDVNINAGGETSYGGLYAFGGRVELGGLADVGTVGLNLDGDNFSLSFPSFARKSNIVLSNEARINVGADNGGSIAINAHNLEMTGGSQILAGIGSKLGSLNSKAGNIDINATGIINLQQGSDIFNDVLENASGQGGDVNIRADTLRLTEGSQIRANTFGVGQGGNLRINAISSVELIGTNAVNNNPSGLFARQSTSGSAGKGNAGNLTINALLLRVLNGATVSASTKGAGRGAELNIDTGNGRVEVIGTSRGGFGSKISTQAEPTATGAAGNLTIKTGELIARDGGQVSASTFGAGRGGNLTINATSSVELISRNTVNGRSLSGLSVQQDSEGEAGIGNAGNLTINTPLLRVLNGANVSASTFGAGQGGELNIDTGNGRIEVIGTLSSNFSSKITTQTNPNATGAAGSLTINTGELIARDGGQVSASTFGAGRGGNLYVTANSVKMVGQFPTGLLTQTNPNSTGNSGDLVINAQKLTIQDGAGVFVRSLGQGNAGNLSIKADSIRLDNNGRLNANTQSPNKDPNKPQATITLNSTDLILRNRSQITASAIGRNVIGGNININTGVLAVLENSRLSANSNNFRGGRIAIKSEGVFGRQSWYPEILRGQITATGATPELSGTVEINTPNVDPSRGTVELPGYIVNAAALINQHFCARAYNSSFTITGRGGIAPSPYDVFAGETTWEDWRINPIAQGRAQGERVTSVIDEKKVTTTAPKEIVEAQGWVVNKKGQVELVATAENVTPHRLQSVPVECLLNTAN